MAQMMNPNKMSQTDLMNTQSQMSSAALMQKLGKGKRKYTVTLSKANKKYLIKMSKELKKQVELVAAGKKQAKSMMNFFNYLEKEGGTKSKELKLSYDELDFLKKTAKDSLNELESLETKWYQLIKKLAYKIMKSQNIFLLQELSK